MGARAYSWMGASERMVRAVEAGKLQPTLVTLAITAVLFLWAAYAWAGAGVIERLPLTKLALVVICTVYLGRAVAFPFLRPMFPANSPRFWLVSSGICFAMGLLHLVGIASLWTTL
ncbi:hypothetical protein [Comamonas sp. GB3 AK4-5]|uniref:hypothetical protein n=1 Tax=Comamonas sp. GB3 AK4-5 TaxID=3231487 RepID=UPI00351F1924